MSNCHLCSGSTEAELKAYLKHWWKADLGFTHIARCFQECCRRHQPVLKRLVVIADEEKADYNPRGRGTRLWEAYQRVTAPPDTPADPADTANPLDRLNERIAALEEYAEGLTPRVQRLMDRISGLQQQKTIVEGWYLDHCRAIDRLKERLTRLEDTLLDDDD